MAENGALPEMPKRVEIVYQDALKNLAFIKQQEWTVTRYALTAYGALFAVSAAIKANEPLKTAIIGFGFAVAIYATLVLADFKDALEKFRARVKWIYEAHFTPSEQTGLKLLEDKGPFNKSGFIIGLIIVIWAGHLITSLAIWRI